MALFGKSRAKEAVAVRVTPIETKFDQEWFGAWRDRIFAGSGIDQTDPENDRGLVLKLGRLLGYWGSTPMERFDPPAVEQFRSYMSGPDATPWGAMSFIAGWATSIAGPEEKVTASIEQQLEKSVDELISVARQKGNLHDDGWR